VKSRFLYVEGISESPHPRDGD